MGHVARKTMYTDDVYCLPAASSFRSRVERGRGEPEREAAVTDEQETIDTDALEVLVGGNGRSAEHCVVEFAHEDYLVRVDARGLITVGA